MSDLKVVEFGIKDPAIHRYLMLAHGVTRRIDPYDLVVPPNLQVVFFYDPRRADTEIATCVAALPDICKNADNKRRWVYTTGTYKIRALNLKFYKYGNDDTDKGIYNCNGEPILGLNEDQEITLTQAINRFIGSIPPLTKLTTIYIITCSALDNYRGFTQKDYWLPAGKGRRKRKTRRHTRRHRRRAAQLTGKRV